MRDQGIGVEVVYKVRLTGGPVIHKGIPSIVPQARVPSAGEFWEILSVISVLRKLRQEP